MPKPRTGQVVHYVSYGTPVRDDGSQAYESRCRAAIVTEVPKFLPGAMEPLDGCPNGTDDTWVAGLCVLNPDGLFLKEGLVQMEDGRDGGAWHRAEGCEG